VYSIDGADGRTYGPVEIDVLVQWAREGRVVSKSAVTDHDTGRRFLACDLAELAEVFEKQAVTAIATKAPELIPVLDLRSASRPPASRWPGRACPRCGSRQVVRVRGMEHKSAFACCSCLFAPMLLPLLFFLPGTHHSCIECGLEF
jgi:hypothetical protein